MIKSMVPNNFTVEYGHFTIEGHDGAVDVLIHSDPATGSENGLIGAVRTKEDLIERLDEIQNELEDIRDSIRYYAYYHDESIWNTLGSRETPTAKETEVA